jgi:uncharacterized protein DUF3349
VPGQQRENVLFRLLGWLRAGYPQGVPQQDYVALFGILHRDLTNDEIERVVLTLRADPDFPTDDSPIADGRVREAIEQIVLEKPTDADVARVMSHLAMGGWPLALADDSNPELAVDGGEVPSQQA